MVSARQNQKSRSKNSLRLGYTVSQKSHLILFKPFCRRIRPSWAVRMRALKKLSQQRDIKTPWTQPRRYFRSPNNLALCESIEGPFIPSAELTLLPQKDPWLFLWEKCHRCTTFELQQDLVVAYGDQFKFIRNVNNKPRVPQAMFESFWENP